MTDLHAACFAGDHVALQDALTRTRGDDVNRQALFVVTRFCGHVLVTCCLVGFTPLHVACFRGDHVAAVQHGSDPTQPDQVHSGVAADPSCLRQRGNSPLFWAATALEAGPRLLHSLVQAAADPSRKNPV